MKPPGGGGGGGYSFQARSREDEGLKRGRGSLSNLAIIMVSILHN